MAEDPLRWLRDATALVYVDGRSSGTAYLLDHDLAATCAHVLRGAQPGARVELSFSSGAREAVVIAFEKTQDIALLELTASADVAPLTWDEKATLAPDTEWSAFGYPGITTRYPGGAPVPLRVAGQVRDAHALHDGGVPAIQLFCQDFAAGAGARPHGMSGSPVVIGDRLVGHLKRIITADDEPGPDGQRAQLGTVYATPIEHVVQLIRVGRQTPLPQGNLLLSPIYCAPGHRYKPAYYVERDADQISWQSIRSSELIWLQSRWRMGATWFLAHLIDRMSDAASKKQQTFPVVHIDLDTFGITPTLSTEEILQQIAFSLGHEVGADPAKLPSSPLVLQRRLTLWLEAEVLPRVPHKLVLVLDHFDAFARHPSVRDICACLRAWFDPVKNRHLWDKLQVVLVSTFSPATTTVGQTAGSPLATHALPLGDLKPTEAADLARRYGLPLQANEIKEKLCPNVGGHPFFLAVAFHAVATQIADWDKVLRDAENADGVFSEALANSFECIQHYPAGVKALRDLLNNPAALVPDEVGNRLCNIGVLVDQDRSFRFRYKIQETYLRRRLNVAGSPRKHD